MADEDKNPRKQPSNERGKNTVQVLLEATRRLVQKQGGIEKLTVAEIARTAGVAVASVYQFFPTKGALLAACLEAELERLSGEFASHAIAMHERRAPLDDAVPELTLLSMNMVRDLLRAVPMPSDASRAIARAAVTERAAALISGMLTVRAEDDVRLQGKNLDEVSRVVARLVTDFGLTATDLGDEEFASFSREVVRLVTRYLLTPDEPGPPNT